MGLLVVILLFVAVLPIQAARPEADLLSSLMSTYDKRVRPVENPGDMLQVHLSLSLLRIEQLNEPAQTLSTMGCTVLYWQDYFLRWDPAAHGNLTNLVIPAVDIWRPELTLLNGIHGLKDIGLKEDVRINIHYYGTVIFVLCEKYETSCNLDMALFPHDTQTCPITFAYWMYREQMVNISMEDVVDLASFEEIGSWKLVNTTSQKKQSPENDGIGIPVFNVDLQLERVPQFFYMTIIIPTIVFVVCSVMTFVLPVESGEKIGLSVTILLSYAIVMLLIADVTPRTGAQPYISTLIVVCMAVNALGLVMEILVLKLFYPASPRPLPKWAKKLFLIYLGRAVCYKYSSDDENDSNANDEETDPKDNETNDTSKAVEMLGDDFSSPNPVLDYIKLRRAKMAEDAKDEKYLYEWQQLSVVVDRLVMVACIIILLGAGLSTVGLMIVNE